MRNKVRRVLLILICSVAFAITSRAQFVDLTRVNTSAMTHDEWATQILAAASGKRIISAGVDGRIAVPDAASGRGSNGKSRCRQSF